MPVPISASSGFSRVAVALPFAAAALLTQGEALSLLRFDPATRLAEPPLPVPLP